MKNVVLLVSVLMFYNYSFSQTSNSEKFKKLKFGFNIGAKYSNLHSIEDLPENAKIQNAVGFSFGPIMEYSFTKNILISPKIELAYNNSSLDYTYNDNTKINYEFLNTSLDFMAHFIYKFNGNKIKPYILIGPNYKYPISKFKSNIAYKGDFAIDFGIGFEKIFNTFILAPELRYSYGLIDINYIPITPPLNFHSITFAFNFK